MPTPEIRAPGDSPARCALKQNARVIYDDVLAQLTALPSSPERDEFLHFVSSAGAAALSRDGGPEHLTASCFVFTADLQRTLLCFHGKGRFWVQLGGHIEQADSSAAAAALREAREESGIDGLSLVSSSPVDLDRHELHGGFSCHAHWDLGFAAIGQPDDEITVSEESEDVRWFPVDALPQSAAEGLGRRIAKARQAASVARE